MTMKKTFLIFTILAIFCLWLSGHANAATYSCVHSNDDTVGMKNMAGAAYDVNSYTLAYTGFGRWASPNNQQRHAFIRYILDIPRASKVTASKITSTAQATNSIVFNTTIYGGVLSGSPAWKDGNGLSTTNYANCTALLTIALRATSIAWNSVAAWTAESEYDTPSLNAIIQEFFDDYSYDPMSATDKYVLIKFDDGDGDYTTLKTRNPYAYDNGSKDTVLTITSEPWGEIRTANGMKYDSVSGEMKYYDY